MVSRQSYCDVESLAKRCGEVRGEPATKLQMTLQISLTQSFKRSGTSLFLNQLPSEFRQRKRRKFGGGGGGGGELNSPEIGCPAKTFYM